MRQMVITHDAIFHLISFLTKELLFVPGMFYWQRFRKLQKPCRTFGSALLEYICRPNWGAHTVQGYSVWVQTEKKSAGLKIKLKISWTENKTNIKGQQKCPGHLVRQPDKSARPALSISNRSGSSGYFGPSVFYWHLSQGSQFRHSRKELEVQLFCVVFVTYGKEEVFSIQLWPDEQAYCYQNAPLK